MSEMVENVARAIFEAEYSGGEGDEYRWERSVDAYHAMARAAIEAMREPTPAVFYAVRRECGADARSAWYAGIDAALSQSTGRGE